MKKSQFGIWERCTLSGGRGKIGEVYKTMQGKQLANPEEDQEGWKQVEPNIRRKVIPKLISGPSHNPLYGWEFHQF